MDSRKRITQPGAGNGDRSIDGTGPAMRCSTCGSGIGGVVVVCAACARRGHLAAGEERIEERAPRKPRNTHSETVEALLMLFPPDEVNWSALARKLGISRQAVHQLKERALLEREPILRAAVALEDIALRPGARRFAPVVAAEDVAPVAQARLQGID
jgi:hypothetical protein